MYYTGEHLYRIIANNIYKIPHDIKGVIAIARGGLFPGFIISEHFNIPITTLDKFIENQQTCWFNESTTIKFNEIINGKLLIVDDSIDTGNSIYAAMEKIKNISNFYTFSFIYAAIHSTYLRFDNLIVLDDKQESFRLYEFNLFRTYIFNNVVTDLDGVLCIDPKWGLDTKENEYIDFINTAPKYLNIPSIDIILTSRLEKYRKQTEDWLYKNNIKYNKLIMSPLENINDKLLLMKENKWSDAIWKCNEYKNICGNQQRIPVMIESNLFDAQYIKQNFNNGIIFCTDKNCFIE